MPHQRGYFYLKRKEKIMKITKELVENTFSRTPNKGGGIGNDLKKIEETRIFFKDYFSNTERYNHFINNSEEWKKQLMLKGELEDYIIVTNLRRSFFIKDRGFFDENGNYVEDTWQSTFMVGLRIVIDEDTTLSFFSEDKYKNKELDFYIIKNPNAASYVEDKLITGESDFYVKVGKEVIPCEQKTVTKEDTNFISIRKSQIKLFDKYIYKKEKAVILVKYINVEKGYIRYSFYDYRELLPYLNNKNESYYFNRENVKPFKEVIDHYKTNTFEVTINKKEEKNNE
jgi:hypothetical protein